MYKKPSKRRQLIQRTIIYSGMSLAVVVLVAALLFVVLGYQLNRADGRIEQGGLVQFDSIPNGADVTIDGVPLGFRTATKSTLNAGNHYFTMTKNGYKPWQKSVNLAPGAVLWLNYARLVPNDLKQEHVARLASVSTSAASPDQKWMAVSENGASPAFKLFDISRSEVKATDLALPQNVFTAPGAGKTQHFSIEAWDPSSKYLLVKHVYNDTSVEWLIVDTSDVSKTKNITVLLNIAISKIIFSNTDSNILYVQTGTDIRKVDINAATLSRPLIENVAEFNLFDRSTIAFTTLLNPATKSRMAGYYEDGAEKPYELRSYVDDGTVPLHVALGKYFNEPYVAISYGDAVDILRGNLPKSDADMAKLKMETKMTIPGGAQSVTVQTSGRFIIAVRGGDYYVYDNELKQQTRTTLKGQNANVALGWIDDYTAWSGRDGILRLYEFDGANQHDIMPVIERQAVGVSADDVYLYGLTTGADQATYLTRVRMILP